MSTRQSTTVEPQCLYPGVIYPIAGHHDVAKMSQKELIRKPQDSILEKQFPMVFAVYFAYTYGCGGIAPHYPVLY